MTSTTDHRKMKFQWTGNPVSTFWSNLSLTGKLFIMFGVLGLLALLIGIVANRGLRAVQASYEGAIFQGQAMASRSQLVANNLLTARSGEKDFLLYWKQDGFDRAYASHVAKHVNAVQTMKDHIGELYAFGPELGRSLSDSYSQEEYENDLNSLAEATHQYELNFLKTVDLIKVRGFKDTGLEGEFRVAVHNIEENIYDQAGLEQIVITLLQLRRHEKDYLLRGDQEYIDNVHTTAKELKNEILASDTLSQEEKLEMSALTDQYVTAFDRLVQKDREIAVSTETYQAAALVMEPLVRKLSIAGANMSDIDVEKAQAASAQTLLYSSVTWATALLVAAFLSIALSRQITTPVTQLTAAARELEAGNYDVQTAVTSRDEIGTLAAAFNTMVRQLKEAVALVTKRAVELQAVAEIATEASQISDADRMLQTAVEKTKNYYNLYHAHIYLLDDSGTQLVLAAGAGEPGRRMVAEKHVIPLDREQSLVARAAREKKGVTVNDVTTEPGFLPNPLLPETRSELAVPMIVGQQVIGVFDVQSDVVGRFSDADIAVQTTLASQVASAVQNSRSFTEIQRSQVLLSDALRAARLGNWEYDFVNDLFTFSDEFYAIFRTTAEKVGGYRISSADYARIFVHPDDAPLVGSEIQKVLDAKDRRFTTNLEHRIIFSDGEVGYVAVSINVERDENGNITRWYGANQDITERRRLEEINRKRATQQEAINLITQRIQGTTTIESALQIAARELGRALGQKRTVAALEPSAFSSALELNQEDL